MPDSAWRPSRGTTILLGIVSVWPIVYMGLFIAAMAYSFIVAGPPDPEGFGELFKYIVHAYRTDLVPADKKVLWVVILFFGNFIAIPVYWYLYMWRPLKNPAPR